jgi:hypothetical protein
MPVSQALKPEPVTVTELPGGPPVGLTAKADLAMKVIAGKEPAWVIEP